MSDVKDKEFEAALAIETANHADSEGDNGCAIISHDAGARFARQYTLKEASEELEKLKGDLKQELEWKAQRFKASVDHANCDEVKRIKREGLPEYAPTWEAGRACGFHAGYERYQIELTAKDKLIEEIMAIVKRINLAMTFPRTPEEKAIRKVTDEALALYEKSKEGKA